MTSSATSTERGADRAEAERLERRRALMRRWAPLAVAVLAIAPFFAYLVVTARRPSVATLFLFGGWLSLLATGWLLARAALVFDLDTGEPVVGGLTDRRRLDLEREKRVLLKAIREVEFDQAMGKIDDVEAQAIILKYRRRALEVLRLIEADKPVDYEAVIEKELGRRLGGGAARPARAAEAAEAQAAGGAAAAGGAVAIVCGTCETRNDPDSAFCKRCGQRFSG